MSDYKVLVVDDDESIRAVFEVILKDLNVAVDFASDGDAGIEKIKNNEYQLVFLDLNMPGKNGVEVLNEAMKMKPNLHVCVLSAYIDAYGQGLEDVKAKGFAFEVKEKPIGLDQIRDLVARYTEESKNE